MKFGTIILSVWVVGWLLTGWADAESNQKRYAIVIGNGDYSFAPLKNPVNDAQDMRDVLTTLGFEVIYRENAGIKAMDEAVREFYSKLSGGGVGLFYFAGHGIQIKGNNYLIPTDAKIESEADVENQALNANWVFRKMADAGNEVNIIILDACRNNPFSRSIRSVEQGLAKMRAPKGSIIFYSTAPGDVAEDGPGRNGVYTQYLLKHITTPGIQIEDVMKRVRNDVRKETNNKQTPWETNSLTGDFYFAGTSALPPIQTSIPPQSPMLPKQPTQPIESKRSSQSPTVLPTEPEPHREDTDSEAAFTNRLGMKFVYIAPGTFMMGSPLAEPGRNDTETQHPVTLTKGFYMQTTEVTQKQWSELMGSNPSVFRNCGDNCPVENVSWEDVRLFIEQLNQQERKAYRLPTEAEWEFAARAGTTTAVYSGPVRILGAKNSPDLDAVAWYGGNSCVQYSGATNCSGWRETQYSCPYCGTHPVAQKQKNNWGLYDMIGNVWEWCQDWYIVYSSDPAIDPTPSASGTNKVFRGGAWNSSAKDCRSASSDGDLPTYRSSSIGFRLVLPANP